MGDPRAWRRVHARTAAVAALLIVGAAVGPVRAVAPLALVVTTGNDDPGSTCGATCSLRQAINAANANSPATDVITFNVPGGPATINVGSPLPDITDTVVIDGTSQPGTKVVGGAAGPTAVGLHVLASGTVIKGLDIEGFGGDGIRLDHVAGTLIGGATAADGNVIHDNGRIPVNGVIPLNAGDGVAVVGDSSSIANQITANRIYGNGSLAIDLGDDNLLGIVGNSIGGPPVGPNGLINGPSIDAPVLAPASAVTINPARASSGSTARIDVFWSPTCPVTPDAAGFVPQAAEFLGSVIAPEITTSIPHYYGTVSFTLPASRTTGYITATSTAGEGTSEVSSCAIVAAPTDLATSAVVTPSGAVDVGTPVHLELHVGNLGPADHTDPLGGLQLTAGSATLTAVTASQGTCALLPDVAFCSLGALAAGSTATVGLDLVPTAAGTLTFDGEVADLASLDPNPTNDSTPLSIIVLAAESTSGTVSGGQSVSTDAGENDGATPTDPLETSVTMPPGAASGTISIAERPDAVPPPIGYQFFGQASVITAPTQTAAHPLVFQFTLDGTVIPSNPLVIFRNGVPVPPCTVANPGTDPSATPDPCYLPAVMVGDDLVLTVRTSQASTWRVGTRLPFTFAGFFAPVDNGGVLNQVKAGQAVPVKFSLGGDKGLSIFLPGSPSSVGVACGTAHVDPVEQTVTAGSSALTYDAASGRYQYVWKSDKAWAGTCRQLVMAFADGSTATALFSFVK
jgi:CSLREA domain-containing protein